MDMKQKKAEYVEKAEEILRSSSTAERQESNASARRVLADEADELRRKNEEAEREGRPKKPTTDADLLLILATNLKVVKEFGYARRILRLARTLPIAGGTRLKSPPGYTSRCSTGSTCVGAAARNSTG